MKRGSKIMPDLELYTVFLSTEKSVQEKFHYFIQFYEEKFGIDLESECCTYEDSFSLFLPVVENVVKKGIIYAMLLYPVDAREHLANYVLRNSITTLALDFGNEADEAYLLFAAYIGYLENFDVSFNKGDEYDVLEKYPWINELHKNKGYRTINDFGRSVLEDLYFLGVESCLEKYEICKLFDGYFSTSVFDEYITKDAATFAANNASKALFKKYQMRLLLSDAYARESMNDEGISEFLEEKIEAGDFRLPTSRKERYQIYGDFIDEIGETLRSTEYSNLFFNDKVMTLGKVNPLFFLD